MDREQKEILNQLEDLKKEEKISMIDNLIILENRKSNKAILENLRKKLE